MDQRKVEILLSPADISRVAETVGYKSLQEAIGYFSVWGYSFPSVRILAQDKCDLLATYQKDDGSCGYVIGAIWSETDKNYSFHS